MENRKKVAMGAGGVVAVGAAIGAGLFLRPSDDAAERPTARTASGAYEVCLKTDLRMVEGASKHCYAADDIDVLMESPVLDDSGAPVSLSLSHPSDQTRPLAVVDTCDRYRSLTKDGWYALTTREMRRAGFFERACGVLAMLREARPADVTYFKNEAMSEADARSLAAGDLPRMGPAPATSADEPSIARAGDNAWTMSGGGQTARLEEIAHADFNHDGRGDMLVFIAMSVEGGTAQGAATGILDKPSATAPVRFIARGDIR